MPGDRRPATASVRVPERCLVFRSEIEIIDDIGIGMIRRQLAAAAEVEIVFPVVSVARITWVIGWFGIRIDIHAFEAPEGGSLLKPRLDAQYRQGDSVDRMSIEDLSGALRRSDRACGTGGPVLLARGVNVFRWSTALKQRVSLLADVNWRVEPGQHWAVMGPNGAGKTTLLRMAAAESHPSEGTFEVLGERLGATDMRRLRESIGLVDNRVAATIPARRPVFETILSGAFNSIAIQRQRLDPSHTGRARHLMELVGLKDHQTRGFGECSQGERQRVLLARALMPEPCLLLFDEAAAGLDLPSREQLVSALDAMAREDRNLTTVAVTHHIEEIPPSTTHALLLRETRVLASGPIGEVLTSEKVSACFGLPVEVTSNHRRFAATLASASGAG